MTIEEFKSLELKDKVLYKGKIIIVKKMINYGPFTRIKFKHNNEAINPDIPHISFWSNVQEHQELIKQMIKIPNR